LASYRAVLDARKYPKITRINLPRIIASETSSSAGVAADGSGPEPGNMGLLHNPAYERFCQRVYELTFEGQKRGVARTAAYREVIYQGGDASDGELAPNARRYSTAASNSLTRVPGMQGQKADRQDRGVCARRCSTLRHVCATGRGRATQCLRRKSHLTA
jgi:hypothetical protein